MTQFKQQSLAIVIAIVLSTFSLQAIVTVPPAQASTPSMQSIELA